MAQKPICPCCGAGMDEEDLGTKSMLRCPSCGVTDVRMKG